MGIRQKPTLCGGIVSGSLCPRVAMHEVTISQSKSWEHKNYNGMNNDAICSLHKKVAFLECIWNSGEKHAKKYTNHAQYA